MIVGIGWGWSLFWFRDGRMVEGRGKRSEGDKRRLGCDRVEIDAKYADERHGV